MTANPYSGMPIQSGSVGVEEANLFPEQRNPSLLGCQIRLFRMARRGLDRHGPFQRIGPARAVPPTPGKRLADARSNSSARDEVFKKEFCSADPSIVWLAFLPGTGAYTSTRAGVPFVCRHFVSARAEVPKRRLCNFFHSKGARIGHCVAITVSDRRRGGERHE